MGIDAGWTHREASRRKKKKRGAPCQGHSGFLGTHEFIFFPPAPSLMLGTGCLPNCACGYKGVFWHQEWNWAVRALRGRRSSIHPGLQGLKAQVGVLCPGSWLAFWGGALGFCFGLRVKAEGCHPLHQRLGIGTTAWSHLDLLADPTCPFPRECPLSTHFPPCSIRTICLLLPGEEGLASGA